MIKQKKKSQLEMAKLIQNKRRIKEKQKKTTKKKKTKRKH